MVLECLARNFGFARDFSDGQKFGCYSATTAGMSTEGIYPGGVRLFFPYSPPHTRIVARGFETQLRSALWRGHLKAQGSGLLLADLL